jgi:signal peptidase I
VTGAAALESQPAHRVSPLREVPALVLLAIVIAFVVKTFVAQAFYIPSGSMIPQLLIDDRVVVSKLAYRAHEPRRSDIVVFDCPPRASCPPPPVTPNNAVSRLLRGLGERIGVVQPSTDEFIKRVVGLPGDSVEGRDGHVFVNDHLLVEPYLRPTVYTSDFARQVVPPGELWVMGDNRTNSCDSRCFGMIRQSKVVGRAVAKVWPPRHVSFL